MELKDYQIKVLDYLESYLAELKAQKSEKQDYFEFLKGKGKEAVHPEKSDYCQLAWESLKAKMAVYRSNYTVRNDGMRRNIPNVCFKVPTGGGKTLLATAAIQRINQDYFKRNNGFVLWIVPSETIYTQTSKQLRDKEHTYRQMLDRASGGRTLILEKHDRFTAQDVEDNLCIMLLMLQASNRNNKEALKMFKDSGRFESFFPPLDDYNANNALLSAVPNLDTADLMSDEHCVISGISIKHSLGNVMRLLRPIAIFDEGHRGATQLAQDTVNSFNTSFILELSATPKDHSNVLVNVGGQELKKEQMIKLPINVTSYGEANWQHTLNQAHAKTLELNNLAAKYQAEEGRYIRPIMVIKAEPKRKGEAYDHVEDIKSYLIKNLNVLESQIRIKLADNNEMRDDDLFDKFCPVRYIITKDALKEGWDCSFAYVLAILSNTRGQTALTQFIGRVLRQPYALETSIPALNQCYVYCDNADVNSAAKGIKQGLEDEGMGDVSDQIVAGSGQATGKEKVTLKRKEKYKGTKIFLPSLNVIRNGKPVSFDYHADILADIQWDDYSFDALEKITLADKEMMDYQHLTVDWKKDKVGQIDIDWGEKQSEKVTNDISITLMVSQLMEKVPNAWQAFRIIQHALSQLKYKGISETKIAINSVFIVEEIKKDCFRWMLEQSEANFRRKLDDGTVFLRLLAEPFSKLNWHMAEQIEMQRNLNETAVTLEKSMFQPQYFSNYNGLENPIALAINNKDVVEWWHRLAVRGTEYSIQGWKRERIYPDFLVKLEAGKDGIERLYFIESKGEHLEGNKDTSYKQELFKTINAALIGDIKPKGEMTLVDSKEKISFHMVFENEWENELNGLLV
ncbi:restriction endonuclease subunit R [Candidatus Methylospira mobilis]|uniref:Restriction endonuclease subunit R n=1 Tax=Candidatus Methylospira mobilis TaxID=1808979 RepID=A0A5Q0BKN2_9GAMM|nr:DEAD/DEAH box helicase family protein [Candidatus Methylospira mobilis]QFY42677.1 restriction endonuclease subunit R [Candidatus Methylospira mobilis]